MNEVLARIDVLQASVNELIHLKANVADEIKKAGLNAQTELIKELVELKQELESSKASIDEQLKISTDESLAKLSELCKLNITAIDEKIASIDEQMAAKASELGTQLESKANELQQQLKIAQNSVFDGGNLTPEMGEIGGGVCTRHAIAASLDLVPLAGCESPASENFGNYINENGDIFVCIPRIYYKIDNTDPKDVKFYVSFEPQDGYTLAYAFKKSDGTSVPCVFVSKYKLAGNWRNKLSLQAGSHPLITMTKSNSNYHGFIDFILTQADNERYDCAGLFNIARGIHPRASIHYAPLRFVYFLINRAHTQAKKHDYFFRSKVMDSTWYDFPQGNSLNGKDDTIVGINFTLAGLEGIAACGCADMSELGKCTHNLQACGVADLKANVYEIDAGWFAGADGFYMLNGIDKLLELNIDNIHDASKYTKFNGANRVARGVVGAPNKVPFSAAVAGDDYLCDNALMTLGDSRCATDAATEDYGKNYQNLPVAGGRNVPRFCGRYNEGTWGGLLHLSTASWDLTGEYMGARAIIIPN